MATTIVGSNRGLATQPITVRRGLSLAAHCVAVRAVVADEPLKVGEQSHGRRSRSLDPPATLSRLVILRAVETLEDCLGLFSARETGHGLVCPAHGCRWYQGKMRLEQRTGPVVHPATRRLLRPGEPGVLRLFRHQARPIADGAEVRPSKREADLQGTRRPGESPPPGRPPRRATSTM